MVRTYRAIITTGHGSTAYGVGEIVADLTADRPDALLAQVEVWMLRHVPDGGNRPPVGFSIHEDGEAARPYSWDDVESDAGEIGLDTLMESGATEAEARAILCLEPPQWKIEARDRNGHWDAACVASDESTNRFSSEAEAEETIDCLRALGDEWAEAEYRVVRAN